MEQEIVTKPSGTKLLKTLIDLLSEQEGVEIKYIVTEKVSESHL